MTAHYKNFYMDPIVRAMQKEFYYGGCGQCEHHGLTASRKSHSCKDGWDLWPNGTSKSCPGFRKKVKVKS
jgi:hypothetical protein